jgi:type IV secretory pathway VirB2 component (pilin)
MEGNMKTLMTIVKGRGQTVAKIGAAALMLMPTVAMAQVQNQTNIEGVLNAIVSTLTGRIASLAAVIAIVIMGYMMWSGNGDRGFMIRVIAGIAIVFSAAWMVSIVSGTQV